MLTYFRVSRDKEGFIRFLEKNGNVFLSEKAIMVLNTYLKTELKPVSNGEKTKMCVGWQYFKQRTMAKGMAKGLKKGLKEGRDETLEKVVQEALKNDLGYDVIQKITGLSMDEIKKMSIPVNA